MNKKKTLQKGISRDLKRHMKLIMRSPKQVMATSIMYYAQGNMMLLHNYINTTRIQTRQNLLPICLKWLERKIKTISHKGKAIQSFTK